MEICSAMTAEHNHSHFKIISQEPLKDKHFLCFSSILLVQVKLHPPPDHLRRLFGAAVPVEELAALLHTVFDCLRAVGFRLTVLELIWLS